MMDSTKNISLRNAAHIAGISILVMAIAAPYAELYVYPKIVVGDNAIETTANIIANKSLFISGIFAYLVTFISDIIAAWALYILLKQVNNNLSLLTALFRLVYSLIALIALLNLVTLLRVLNTADNLPVFESDQLYVQVKLSFIAFKSNWSFSILFFGIHLGLLGFLAFRSGYIPKILGVLLIISGLGYFITAIGPYLFPDVNLHVANFTFYGELIFMLWLLIRGHKIKDGNTDK